MPVDVIVVTNGSLLGEELLKLTWYTAQKLFHEYGVEVYVIPYYSKDSRVSLIINDIEFTVNKKLTPEELTDLILSALGNESPKTQEVSSLGLTLHDDNDFCEGVLIY
ncbi:MAG: hypothetical protein B7O98_07220 [Zestosphaera tikiterensis]|uniref:Uncharacterized protein n=1 Tax=Zestosphaera tikiterensis TaxID=1973259 RepID=A0A2R7Y4E8_9CREN|nr:MAG: hypothetical protein B7O98_07220 [Zestosphaera tikiterensis]